MHLGAARIEVFNVWTLSLSLAKMSIFFLITEDICGAIEMYDPKFRNLRQKVMTTGSDGELCLPRPHSIRKHVKLGVYINMNS